MRGALAQAIIGAIAVVDVEAVVIDGLLPRPLLLDTVARISSQFTRLVPGGLIAPAIIVQIFGYFFCEGVGGLFCFCHCHLARRRYELNGVPASHLRSASGNRNEKD